MLYSVYIHTAPNGKVYVGITKQDPKERWKNGRAYRNSRHFWQAIQKYGWDNIKHEVVCDGLSKEEAEREEKRLISLHKSTDREYGYNILDGGNVSSGGWHHTVESRERIKKAVKHRKTPEGSALALKQYVESKKVTVFVYDLRGKLIKKCNSAREAEDITSVSNANIIACCRGKYEQCNGYVFSYSEIEESEKPRRRKRKPVIAYTLGGMKVAEFISAESAGKEMHIEPNDISRSCNFQCLESHRLIWLYADEESRLQERLMQLRTAKRAYLPVVSIDIKSGSAVEYFDSISDAMKAGFAGDKISMICHGKPRYKSTGGFKWRYATNDEINEHYKQRRDK